MVAQSYDNRLEIKRLAAVLSNPKSTAEAFREFLFTLMPALKTEHEKDVKLLAEKSEQWTATGPMGINI